jgi:predicted peptidase
MIVYLHGAGSTGDDPEAVKSGGLPARLAAGHAIPFIALSPQCPRGSTFSSEGMAARLAVLVEETGSAFRVDRARVSLTGFSMGGNGAWDLAAARPELFSRLAPVGSEGLARPADARRLAGLPVWIFQGSADGTFSVDLAERSRALLESVGVDARFTRWEGAGHLESAALSYADADLYEWLAGARKEETR